MEMIFSVFEFLAFGVHSFLSLLLIKRFVKAERFSPFLLYIFAAINGLFLPRVILYLSYEQTFTYIAIAIVFLLESLLLFRDRIWVIIGITFGLLMHFFTCRSVVLGLSALFGNTSTYNIINDPTQLAQNSLLVVLVHIVVLTTFIAVIPRKAVKEIIGNRILLDYIVILMIVLGLFFIFNARVFELEHSMGELALQQVVLAVILLGIFYLLLLFMIRLVMMDTYQKVIKELEQKLDQSQKLTDALFNFTQTVIEVNVTKDKSQRILIDTHELPVDQDIAFTDFLRHYMVTILHPESRELVDKVTPAQVCARFAKGEQELSFDYQAKPVVLNKKRNGVEIDESQYRWYQMRINSRLDKESGDVIAIFAIDEIQAAKEAELALLSKTERDGLTGAYNKEAMSRKVASYLNQGKQGRLFLFDVDNFKSVNDKIGHAFGDQVLCEIYDKVRALFREEDLIGRFGGDEFIAFIAGTMNEENQAMLAQRICDVVEEEYRTEDGEQIKVSASIGIASAPDDGTTYEQLFHVADIALYDSKHRGKNTFTIYKSS